MRASTSGTAEGLSHFDPRASPFDPRFRVACDLYNGSLAGNRAARASAASTRGKRHITTRDSKGFTLSIVHHGFLWRPEEFGSFLFCEDYRAIGLANQHRTYGLGVPSLPRTSRARQSRPRLLPAFGKLPRDRLFPFQGHPGRPAQQPRRPAGTVQSAVDPGHSGGQRRHAAGDRPDDAPGLLPGAGGPGQGRATAGFLRPDCVELQGIYLLEPYQPGKIPVVFVHGLLSSPLTSSAYFNDLHRPPVVAQEHYQFWFYLYPTANPYLNTAADLRKHWRSCVPSSTPSTAMPPWTTWCSPATAWADWCRSC